MEKKNILKFIITFVIVGALTVLLIVAPYMKHKNNALSPAEEDMMIPSDNFMLISLQEIIDHDPALYGLNTISEADDNYYPFKVMLTNIQDLTSTTLPTYGRNSLEEYMHRYVTYYTDVKETYWEFEYEKNTFEGDVAFPRFNVILHTPDEDIRIKCTYNTSTKRYIFVSKLDGSV